MNWKNNLPEPMAAPFDDRIPNALSSIADAMEANFQVNIRTGQIYRAIAELRALRKSIGIKSNRDRPLNTDVRISLREAVRRIVWVDETLRAAEECKKRNDTINMNDNLEYAVMYLRAAEGFLINAVKSLEENHE